MNELSVLDLYVAGWKLFGVFCWHRKRICSDLQRYFGGMSQTRATFSAVLNVCLSALLDWGHIVQHLRGLSPRFWAELKSLGQLFPSMGTPAQGNSLRNCSSLVWRLYQSWELGHQCFNWRTDLKKGGVLVRPSRISHQKSWNSIEMLDVSNIWTVVTYFLILHWDLKMFYANYSANLFKF